MELNGHSQRFYAALRSADSRQAQEVVRSALSQGISREEVLDRLVVPSLDSLGRGWDEGTVSLTQLYMGGRIAEDVVDRLLTPPATPPIPWGRVLIGTLSDSHGMGQRVVSHYLATAGAQVVSLGIGVKPETFTQRAKAERFDVIAVSVLMYRSALLVKELRQHLSREGVTTPVLVGGAPFNMDRTLWQEVNASAMGSNPAEGIAVTRRLMGLQP